MEKMLQEIQDKTEGEILKSTVHRALYAVDASMFEVLPDAIFIPQNQEDVQKAVSIAYRYGISTTARGAATSTTGASLNKGLIIDTSKYLNRVIEINKEEKWVRVEPGVIQDDLNLLLSEHGFRLGPDTSSGSRATIGGMIANNSSGARSLKFGTTYDAVMELKLLLSDGEIIYLKELSKEEYDELRSKKNFKADIHNKVHNIIKQYKEDIQENFPKLSKQAAGYCLDKLLEQNAPNLAKLVVGSEGSLGFVLEAKLKIINKPKATALCAFQCSSLSNAISLLTPLLKNKPLSLELIDEHIISMGRKAPALQGMLDWLAPSTKALIIFEQNADSLNGLKKEFQTLGSELSKHFIERSFFYEEQDQNQVWQLRKSGLGLLMSKRGYKRGYAFIEDLVVPPESLKTFVIELENYLKTHNKQAGIYGHAGAGLIHVRPFVNLLDQGDINLIKKFMLDITDMVVKYKGSLTGEHGDGLLRSYLNPRLFGEKVYQAFCEIKAAFDPKNLMNPGKIIGSHPIEKDLRHSPKSKLQSWNAFLDFSKEKGLELSVDLCNGNALCRKSTANMCPSFQATKNEQDSTRARAQLFRSYINGHVDAKTLLSPEGYKIFDLCLECKACKKECPSQVDIAKIKPEYLYHYYKIHKPSMRTKIFAYFDTLTKAAHLTPQLSNYILSTRINRKLLNCLGFSKELSLPTFSNYTFSSWFSHYKQKGNCEEKAYLFIDTYTEFYRPEVGIDAVKVLNALGVYVKILPWSCCGRPAFSKGFLDKAKKHAIDIIDRFSPHIEDNVYFIGLEPSCTYTIKEDLFSLVPGTKANKLSLHFTSLDSYISKLLEKSPEKKQLFSFSEKKNISIHNHCHQKSSCEANDAHKLLSSIADSKQLATGCCGMAGSFAFEHEHYEISKTIAHQNLKPHFKDLKRESLLVANGFSCQHQIKQHFDLKPYHLSQVLLPALKH